MRFCLPVMNVARPAMPVLRPAYAVLMVCTGNICRSPTADGLLRHAMAGHGLQDVVLVDSAGTHGYHTGEPPDARSTATARRHGVDISMLRARPLVAGDFSRFDLILTMDRGHYDLLQRRCPQGYTNRIRPYLSYAPQFGHDVPDPYYGAENGFDTVFRMCTAVTEALVSEILALPAIRDRQPAQTAGNQKVSEK